MEGNRDGSDDNHSWNCGAEGDTNDAGVIQLRKQLVKNHICMLFFSMGTPMLLGGDECMRTQQGNNNAYCQDNEMGWFNWNDVTNHADMLEFVTKAIALTKRYTILQQRKFFQERDLDGDTISDITWFGPDLGSPRWDDPEARTLCYRLDGGETLSALGKYYLHFILNADFQLQAVKIPALLAGQSWYRVIDTSLPSGEDFLEAGNEIRLEPGDSYLVNPRSVVMLLSK
jgi:isoamylase